MVARPLRRLVPHAALAAAVLLVAQGCGGDGATGPQPPGSLSFTYAGEENGQFEAVGSLAAFTGTARSTGAAAWLYAPSSPGARGFYRLEAVRGASQGGDEFTIDLHDAPGPGTYTHCPDGVDPPPSGCVFLAAYEAASGTVHVLREFTVTVTSVTGGRLRATFSGRLGTTLSTVTITGGMADLPIRSP